MFSALKTPFEGHQGTIPHNYGIILNAQRYGDFLSNAIISDIFYYPAIRFKRYCTAVRCNFRTIRCIGNDKFLKIFERNSDDLQIGGNDPALTAVR